MPEDKRNPVKNAAFLGASFGSEKASLVSGKIDELSQAREMLDRSDWGTLFNWDELGVITRFMQLVRYKKDQTIFEEGERTNNYMALIVDGKVSIRKHSSDETEVVVVTISKGGVLGEMSLIDEEPRSATAVALENVTLLILTKEEFERMIKEFPGIGVKALKKICLTLSRRLRQTTGKYVYLR